MSQAYVIREVNNPANKKEGRGELNVKQSAWYPDRPDLSSLSDLILFNGIMLFTKKDKGKSRITYDRSSPWRNKAELRNKGDCFTECESVKDFLEPCLRV